jgi:2-polyprenyl-3-methyl-5-hydroxy-6-metoxy-1,4-benzoquinol methylase
MPSEHMTYKIGRLTPVSDRAAFIANMCRDRCVMHLGCAAWPLTDQQWRDGMLLHVPVSKAARRAYGIDLSEEGLVFLRDRGFKDLIRWDVEKLDELRVDDLVEIIVAGEIMEHLSNPGLFLRGISRFMRRHKSRLIISVPNAFSYRHFIPVLLSKTEFVMPDHTAYYSFSTLRELLQRHDLQIIEHYTCTYSEGSTAVKRLLKRTMNAAVMRTFPQVSEGLMIVAQAADGRD